MNQKQISFIKNVVIIVLILIVATNLDKCRRGSYIWVEGLPEQTVYFADSNKQLKLAEVNDEGFTRIRNKIKPGSYLLYYQEDESTRYYGTLRVKDSKETKVRFRKYSLPQLSRQLILNTPEDVELGSIFTHYTVYSASGDENSHNAEINLLIRGERSTLSDKFTFKWTLNVDGNIVSREEIFVDEEITNKTVVYESKNHFYEVYYDVKNNIASLKIAARFKS